jgi:hypothetical protein
VFSQAKRFLCTYEKTLEHIGKSFDPSVLDREKTNPVLAEFFRSPLSVGRNKMEISSHSEEAIAPLMSRGKSLPKISSVKSSCKPIGL